MIQHKCILDGCTEFNIWVGGGKTILTCRECARTNRTVKYQISIESELGGK